MLVAMFLAFEGEAEITRTTESKQADRILAEGFPQEVANGQAIAEVVVVRAEDGDVRAATTRSRSADLADELRAAGAIRVVTYGEERRLVSQDRDSTVLLLALGRDREENVEGVVDAVERLDDEPGHRAAVTGGWTSDADEDAASLEDLKKGELFFGAPLALVVLLLVFGAVVAGLVPLMLAIASIVVALALVALLAQAYDLSVFTQNMLIGMALALGIDYSLFTLSAIPRGAAAGAGEAGRDRHRRRHRRPCRPLPAGLPSCSRCSGSCSFRARSSATLPPARSWSGSCP